MDQMKDKVNKKAEENGWNKMMGMAWVKAWLRRKEYKNRMREHEMNYKKEEEKDEKE